MDHDWPKSLLALPAAIDMSAGDVTVYATMRTESVSPTIAGDNRLLLSMGPGGIDSVYDPCQGFARVKLYTDGSGTVVEGNDGSYTDPSYQVFLANGATLDPLPISAFQDPNDNIYVQVAVRIHYEAGGALSGGASIGHLSLQTWYRDEITNPGDPEWVSLGSATGPDGGGLFEVNSVNLGALGFTTPAVAPGWETEESFFGALEITQILVDPYPLAGDFDLDGDVDIEDLAVLGDQWLIGTEI